MSLHETRYEVVTPQIDLTRSAVGAAGANTSYAPSGYRYIRCVDLIGEDVDQLSISQYQIGGALPASDCDESSPFFQR
jgi:hypothetical protein